MKKLNNLFFIFCISVMLCAMAVGCFSCTTTKNLHSVNTSVDSSYTKSLEDSLRVVTSENSRLESEVRELQYSGVYFDTTGSGTLFRIGDDTSTQHPLFVMGDNKIEIDANGTLKAEGRIKSAFVSKDIYQKVISDWERKYDSLRSTKDKVETRLVTNTVTKDKYVKRRFGFSLWILVFIAGMIVQWRFKVIDRLIGLFKYWIK